MTKVEKKEGAVMTCGKCDTKLTCHAKTYDAYTDDDGVDHPASTVLQWQNPNLTAHYKWKAKGKYDCNIPESVSPPLTGPISQAFMSPQQFTSPDKETLEKLDTLIDLVQSYHALISEHILKEKHPIEEGNQEV